MILEFQSVDDVVIAPASTGGGGKGRNAVTETNRTDRGNLCMVIPGPRVLGIMVMKLMEPEIRKTPDKWGLEVAKSTAPPE